MAVRKWFKNVFDTGGRGTWGDGYEKIAMAIARRILCALSAADEKRFTENGDRPGWFTGDLGWQMWEDAVNFYSILRETKAAQEREEKVRVEENVVAPPLKNGQEGLLEAVRMYGQHWSLKLHSRDLSLEEMLRREPLETTLVVAHMDRGFVMPRHCVN